MKEWVEKRKNKIFLFEASFLREFSLKIYVKLTRYE